MSVQSKYFKVTDQILLEYKSDQYKITQLKSVIGEEESSYYMYVGNDGQQYCLELDNIPRSKYVKSDKSTYYYGGKGIEEVQVDYDGKMYLGNDVYLGTVIKDKSGNMLREDYLNKDNIRLYILSGYTMNNLAGYSLKIGGKISKVQYVNSGGETIVKRINVDMTVLDWYMPKDELKDCIHWLNSPLYLNSKFYDRYIEITFPSVYDLGHNYDYRHMDYLYQEEDESGQIINMRGYFDEFAGVYIDFATVQPENVTDVDANAGEQEMTLDVAKSFTILPNSNANNFNVRLFEDEESHSIKYYPVYGDIDNARDFTYSVMDAINSGVIPMYNYSSLDNANQGIDEFIELYGEETFKWVIVNELTITYNYEQICQNIYDDRDQVSYSEYYTNNIDYTGKSEETTEFWKSKFIPYIQERTGYECKTLVVTYTCHLVNRMNNTEIVRSASMVVKNPYNYILPSISTSNIVKYKIVNKIENKTIQQVANNVQSQQTAYIREYYDATSIVVKDATSGSLYSQGKMTLKLKRAGSNYMLKLYYNDSNNVLQPYDLSGPYQYKLVFPSITSNKIEIFPNNDSNAGTNLIIGQMTFYISSDKAKSIMTVPTSERYFALTTHYPGQSSAESSIYEGSVDWYA